jgi:ABC-type transport system involved in Fe-S cluster assembly fused permease/ATPase subunit
MLSILSFVSVCLYSTITIIGTQYRLRFKKARSTDDTEAHEKALDSLVNVETVKYLNHEMVEAPRFVFLSQFQECAFRTGGWQNAIVAAQQLMQTTCLLLCILVAGQNVALSNIVISIFV